MTTLTSNDISHSVPVLTSNSGTFLLEVKQPQAEDRRVQLIPGKCTIGSSERCQVQIEGTEVRPLHCLVLLEGSNVTVTRWAQGALLNGREFATAPFQAGDTLQIGEAKISLVADSVNDSEEQVSQQSPTVAGEPSFAQASASMTSSAFATPRKPSSLPQTQASFPANPTTATVQDSSQNADTNEVLDRLKSAKETARGRCRKLVTLLRSMRSEASNFDQRIDHLENQLKLATQEREQLNAELANLQSASTDHASQTAQEMDRLISELSVAYEKANSAETALLDSGQHADQLRNEFEQRLANTQAQLEASEDAFAALEENFVQVRTELEQQLLQAQQELASKSNALTQVEQNSDSLRDELERQLSEFQEKQTATEETLSQKEQERQQLEANLAELKDQQDQWDQVREAGELQRSKLAQALADRERSVETLQNELDQFRVAADQADASRMEQAEELSKVQAELELLQAESEQLRGDLSRSQQYQAGLEQTVADSEQNLEVFQLELEKFQLTSRQTEQELADNSAELESLKTEFAQLLEERDQLKAKRTEYQLREQGSEHEIASRDAKIEELTRQIETLEGSCAEASQGAAEQGSQVEKLERELEELQSERDQLINAQAEQVQNLKAWEEAVEVRDRRIRELEQEHDGICQVLQSVEKGAFEQVDACNKLQDQLATLREERDQFATALPEQQQYANQLEQALAERDSQITLLGEELTKSSERFIELESQLANGATNVEALELERNELRAQCEQLTSSQSSQAASKLELENTLAKQEEQIEQLKRQIESSEQQCRDLEQLATEGSQSKDSYQLELNNLKARFESLTTDHQSEQERRQQLDTELAERDQKLELFQVDLKSVQSELERAAQQVKDLEEDRATLNLQLTGLRQELAANESTEGSAEQTGHAELQQERDELADQLNSVRSQLEELQLRATDDSESMGPSQEDLVALEQDRASLQEQLDEREQQARALEAELEEARSQLATEQGELEQLNQRYQQTQGDLEQAQQKLQAAEQTLTERADAESVESTPTSSELLDPETPDDDVSDEVNTTLSGISPDESVYPFDVSGADFSKVKEEDWEGDQEAYPSADAHLAEKEPASSEPEVNEPEQVSWEVPAETSESTSEDFSQDSAAAFAAGETQSVVESDLEEEETEDYLTTEYQPSDLAEEDSTSTEYEDDFEEQADDDAELVLEAQPQESMADLDETPVAADETPDAPAEEPAQEFQPTSFIDQYQHLLEEDDDSPFEPLQPEPAKPAPVENKLGAELEAMHGDQDEDSDEALQAYMSNMLRRMRGDSSNEEAAPPQQPQTPTLNQNPNPVTAVSDVISNVAPQEQPEAPSEDPIDLESLKRYSEKPALPTDLAAMRELANTSARKAIAKHHKKRHLEKAMGLFLVCLVSICVGGYMLLNATAAQDFTGLNFIGGSIAVLVGAVGGFKLLGLLLAAIRDGSAPQSKKAVAKSK